MYPYIMYHACMCLYLIDASLDVVLQFEKFEYKNQHKNDENQKNNI